MTRIILYKYVYFTNILSIACFCTITLTAQENSTIPIRISDSTREKEILYYKHQRDLIDIALLVLHKNPDKRFDSSGVRNTNLYFSVAPIVEYTIATGFSPGIAGNVAFMTSVKEQTNTSSILGAVKYTQKRQFLLPIQSSLWMPGNKYNLLGDWRFLDYPQDTYGFGGFTTLSDKYVVTYKSIRVYEFVLKNIRKNFYIGLGYQLDHHWGIAELDVQPGRVTDFKKYGFSNASTSSGIALDFLYDSRRNSINPEGGSFYANLQILQNSTVLGANSNWNTILIDLRKYIKLPHNTILAFWCYSVFTLGGNPPYLDLPGTGSDTYNNTGRGYEQSRFIGKKMIDLEAEFRFGIAHDGLLGGVIFCNAESVSELESNRLQVLSPGIGLGLRVKFNKFSRTNACVDYGIGTKGSRGFVGNLGEVF